MTVTPEKQGRPQRSIDAIFDAPVDLRFVGAVRRAFGVVVIVHLLYFARPALEGRIYRDRFHYPWWDWVIEPPRLGYHVLLAVGIAAGVAMMLGLASRAATAVALACIAWNLALDQTAFLHNRAFLMLVLFGLSLVPAGGRRDHRAAHTTAWPLWMLRFLVASVYFTSGFTKLLDADWRGGIVTHDRVVRFANELEGIPFEDTIVRVLTSLGFHEFAAPVVIATELIIAIGLWFGATRLLAIWLAVLFHLSIELGASVQVFSIAALAALGIWTSLDGPNRLLVAPRGSPTAAIVRRLDWLVRFEHAVGDEVVLHDRWGQHRGAGARLRVLGALPVTFWFVAPVLAARFVVARLVAGVRRPEPSTGSRR